MATWRFFILELLIRLRRRHHYLLLLAVVVVLVLMLRRVEIGSMEWIWMIPRLVIALFVSLLLLSPAYAAGSVIADRNSGLFALLSITPVKRIAYVSSKL